MRAAEKKILFSYHIDERIPQFVTGDALSVKQIMINLASNAVKFTERGGVSIDCLVEEETNDMIKIKTEVRDSGIGVAPEMQQKIFEEFTQHDPSITRRFGGTGLGLTITKKLTELLNGKIEVSSNEGVGSVFCLNIPFKKPKTPVMTKQKSAVEQGSPSLQNRSVLIVDDEKMNIFLCKTILENWGIKTDSAESGTEALEKFQNNHYDLILLDVQMPEMSGIEVAQRIRLFDDEIKKHVPIIALTADAFSREKKGMNAAGFNEILIKPYTEKGLFDDLKKLLLPEKNHTEKINAKDREQKDTEKQNGRLFSLEYLEKTSGANSSFIVNMLQSFISNNELHLQMLEDAVAANDWNEVYRLTHKMIPSYRYLQVYDSESKLKVLEKISEEKTQLEQAPYLVSEIRAVTEMVFGLLQEEIKTLQQMNGQTHIPDEVTSTQLK